MNKPTLKKPAPRFWFVIASHPKRDWENRYLEVNAETRELAKLVALEQLAAQGRPDWSIDMVVDADREGLSEAATAEVRRYERA